MGTLSGFGGDYRNPMGCRGVLGGPGWVGVFQGGRGVPRVVVGWMGAPTVGGGREQAESQEVLLALRLWHPHTLPGGLPGVALHPNFRQNLRVALLGG